VEDVAREDQQLASSEPRVARISHWMGNKPGAPVKQVKAAKGGGRFEDEWSLGKQVCACVRMCACM
jgi:hypothetical protein